jgi:hypothetical protein
MLLDPDVKVDIFNLVSKLGNTILEVGIVNV